MRKSEDLQDISTTKKQLSSNGESFIGTKD